MDLVCNKAIVGSGRGKIPNLVVAIHLDNIRSGWALPVPETIRVPGVTNWVLGLANIRGNLMPILDMNGYLYAKPCKIRKESRILIINKHGVVAGLLVDEVYGLRRFNLKE